MNVANDLLLDRYKVLTALSHAAISGIDGAVVVYHTTCFIHFYRFLSILIA